VSDDPAGSDSTGRSAADAGRKVDGDAGRKADGDVGRKAGGGGSEDSHAEQVLSQALRLMAGGDAGRSGTPRGATGSPPAQSRRRLTTGQLLLLAAILGLLVGIAAGFVSLLL
jgi:hypothetical protein